MLQFMEIGQKPIEIPSYKKLLQKATNEIIENAIVETLDMCVNRWGNISSASGVGGSDVESNSILLPV